jgi:hypothetical protein
MNKQYKYIFDTKSKKHNCPACDKKRFVRYVDIETNNYLPISYGRCDRESKCGYYLNPYSDGYFKDNTAIQSNNNYNSVSKPQIVDNAAYIPVEVLKQTYSGYDQNSFIQNLLHNVAFPFEVEDIEKIISLYHLGTIKKGYRKNAITFPFIDKYKNIRAIQVKQFNKENHTTGTDFLHSIIQKHHQRNNKPLPKWLEVYNNNDTKVSCLFGEHLLSKYKNSPIALVEAPKSAIYGSLYFGTPEQPNNLVWLAVYNLSSLNLKKCKALIGRTVYLFPDLSVNGRAFNLWNNKAKEIQKQLPATYFETSTLLEDHATDEDKEQGKDIADYLITKDWRSFRKPNHHKVVANKCASILTLIGEPLNLK